VESGGGFSPSMPFAMTLACFGMGLTSTKRSCGRHQRAFGSTARVVGSLSPAADGRGSSSTGGDRSDPRRRDVSAPSSRRDRRSCSLTGQCVTSGGLQLADRHRAADRLSVLRIGVADDGGCLVRTRDGSDRMARWRSVQGLPHSRRLTTAITRRRRSQSRRRVRLRSEADESSA